MVFKVLFVLFMLKSGFRIKLFDNMGLESTFEEIIWFRSVLHVSKAQTFIIGINN